MTDFFSAATPLVATTFEILPERLDLAGIVLTMSGLVFAVLYLAQEVR